MSDWIQLVKDEIWKPSENWTCLELSSSQLPDSCRTDPLKTDDSYVEIWMKGLRIPHPRIGARIFYGMVNCSTSLSHIGSGDVTFNVVNTPDALKKVDGSGLGNAIPVDQLLVGPTPYRGGVIHMEMGLFSVCDGNYVDSFLNVLTDLSKNASIPYISQAIPFVGPVDRLVQILLGANKDNKLEIGIKRSFKKSGYFAIIGASANDFRKANIDTNQIKLNDQYHLIYNNNDLAYTYLVFSIETIANRENWCEIPDVLAAYNDIRNAIKDGNPDAIGIQCKKFSQITRASPDLTLDDVEKINEKVKNTVCTPATVELKKLQKLGNVDEKAKEKLMIEPQSIRVDWN